MGFSHNLEGIEVFVSSSLIKPLGAVGHTSGRQTCPQVREVRVARVTVIYKHRIIQF